MSYTPIVTTAITLQTQAVSRIGFGVPLFIGSHRWFKSRIQTYVGIEEAQTDFPAGSDELRAATAMFSQQPAPSAIQIGRRETDLITYTPDTVTAIGEVFTISVIGTDDVQVDASFTTITGSETAADVTAALVSGLGGVVGVTVADLTGTFTLAPAVPLNEFTVVGENLVKLTGVTTQTELAATTMQAIVDESNDFYFVTAHDKTQAWILDLAADVEARKKLYFVSVQETEALKAIENPVNAADTLGKLQDLGYIQTAGMFYQDDQAYFECGFAAKGAPFDPGTLTWANLRVAGFTDSKDPATGKSLTTTQKGFVGDRNATFTEDVGGITITRIAKVAGGEYIDVIRSKDFLTARITEAYQNKLINSLKVSYDDVGINEMKGVLTNTLDRYVTVEGSPNILQSTNPYTVSFPRASEVSFAQKASRVLEASFTGFLAGAIEVVAVKGILTLDANDI